MKSKRVSLIIACSATLIAFLFSYFSLRLFLRNCRVNGVDAPSYLSNSKFIQQQFEDADYLKLFRATQEQNTDQFDTAWDFNAAVAMSRRMFVPTEMFGEQKYLYRPHIRIYDAHVWTGVGFQQLIFQDEPGISNLISRVRTERVIAFNTDQYGFKNDDRAYSDPGITIMFLGDSFTEGLWVLPDATFTENYRRLLHKNNVEARVLNFGVNGYSALEQRWVLEHFSPVLRPKVVLMNLFPNDVHWDYQNVILDKDIPSENYSKMFADLQGALDFSRRHEISLVISLIPAKDQFMEGTNRFTFQERVKAWCAGHAATCIDPSEFFSRHGGHHLYFEWDPHFSEEGHRLYAQFLAGELRKQLDLSSNPRTTKEGKS